MGKNPPDGRKVKGIVHWVSVKDSSDAEIRVYDRLFTVPNPLHDKNKNFKEFLNKNSLKIIKGKVEKSLKTVKPLDKFQFERIGYFCADNDYTKSYPIFNQTISLRGK